MSAVKNELESLSIELVAVPANMTHFFQPLDLTVNGSAKKFMRKQFITHRMTRKFLGLKFRGLLKTALVSKFRGTKFREICKVKKRAGE